MSIAACLVIWLAALASLWAIVRLSDAVDDLRRDLASLRAETKRANGELSARIESAQSDLSLPAQLGHRRA